jgi:hypothetical protein
MERETNNKLKKKTPKNGLLKKLRGHSQMPLLWACPL